MSALSSPLPTDGHVNGSGFAHLLMCPQSLGCLLQHFVCGTVLVSTCVDRYVSENCFSSHGSTPETELVQPFEKTPGCFLPSLLDVHIQALPSGLFLVPSSPFDTNFRRYPLSAGHLASGPQPCCTWAEVEFSGSGSPPRSRLCHL